MNETSTVAVVGGGLAGSEAALTLANLGIAVRLFEMRPTTSTLVHRTGNLAELVCSNSLKSTKPDSAAGLLKAELQALRSQVFAAATRHVVPAGGALAVDRVAFAADVTAQVEGHPLIQVVREEVADLTALSAEVDAIVLATGPLTSDGLANAIAKLTGGEYLAFYDAAAPIVMADSLNLDKLFRQSRYAGDGTGDEGDYLNAPMDRAEYDSFIEELLGAERVMKKDFESKELFQACQPIEEVARAGHDAPRYGSLKPVGLTDPATGKRPWAAVQLRAEDAHGMSYNLVGFQTNLTFGEQKRVFRMIPGLEHAEFARFGVMHRNTFLDAPRLLDATGRLRTEAVEALGTPVFVAGQLAGTEGYCEAMRSGLHAAFSAAALLKGVEAPPLPRQSVFGALMAYATDPSTADYQPMHVNFGLVEPLEVPVKNKRQRYQAYADRANEALSGYARALQEAGLLDVGEA